MNRKLRLSSVVFTTWLMVITAFMVLTRALDLDLFFVLAVIGLFVVVVMIDTSSVYPRYMQRMKYVVATAILIFGFIIASRIVGILGL